MLALKMLAALATAAALLLAADYSVEGRIAPPAPAYVTLHGAGSSYTKTIQAGLDGKFKFKEIDAGTYVLAVLLPRRGEMRRTVEIGPSTTDAFGRLMVAVSQSELRPPKDRYNGVSVAELKVTPEARKEYLKAEKALSKRDTATATVALKKAVELSPTYAAAWNTLGTMSYHTRDFQQAEQYFRKALEVDLDSYAPLVNLGGVLINLRRFREATKYNQHAVLREPQDALAHSQLGMCYIVTRRYDLAEQSLKEAIRLDPAHFSHPQLYLAELYIMTQRYPEAADVLEDFLIQHPDWEKAAETKAAIQKLRSDNPR
jgi:tetratricopeptide (TPR) repeat protein